MNAIEVRNLTKSFDGKTNAVESLSLEIPEGSVFALLGPNGSGKTTTVRILNGILLPSSGESFVHGLPSALHVREIHAMSGVMTETAQPYENLDPEENLAFFGRLQGLGKAEISSRAAHLLGFFDLSGVRGRRVKTFSSGMKKRLLLAIALLHKPRVLFLDEPTSGLDPEASKSVNDMIRRMAVEEKVTTFLCTHQLRYAEDTCDLFGFISRGKLTGFGTLAKLMEQKSGSVTLEIRGEGLSRDFDGFKDGPGSWKIPVKGDADAAEILGRAVSGGAKVFEARQVRMSLEDLYFAFRKGGTDA